jgi:hypothetical protein
VTANDRLERFADEKRYAPGLNSSAVHTDVVIGGAGMSVTGTGPKGTVEIIATTSGCSRSDPSPPLGYGALDACGGAQPVLGSAILGADCEQGGQMRWLVAGRSGSAGFFQLLLPALPG